MGIGGTEIILILLVALLLFGAKNLPKIARNLGRSMEEFRRATREVSHEIMNAPDEPADQAKEPPRIAGTEPRAGDKKE